MPGGEIARRRDRLEVIDLDRSCMYVDVLRVRSTALVVFMFLDLVDI